jgi:ribonucleoside-diphosphate reductase alpha chain
MTDEGYQTLCGGYLLENETPRDAYKRVARAAAQYAGKQYEAQFFDAFWNNWLCLASPVMSNMGTDRGLPISCNAIHADDSVDSIFRKNHELAMLSKNGAGVSIYLGDIRSRGSGIKGNGRSEGVIPWAKAYDATTVAVSQGSTRRGASALYISTDHGDIEEFINIRRPTGDVNRRCLNTNHGVSLTDKWMQDMISSDKKKRTLWIDILKARVETGEPYMLFIDTVNRDNPQSYKNHNLSVKTSNICSEIVLHTDPEHSFVCCLSSLNLVRWDEWKGTDVVELSIRFLDAVLSEYIDKSEGIPGLECSRRSAIKGRAVGLGVLGFHTLLQEIGLDFEGMGAALLNAEIFKKIRDESLVASKKLAIEFGEPYWCEGTGMRNTHLMAIAPTVSNATISGGYSPSIEPIVANIYSQKSAKGTFIRKNPTLERLLKQMNKDKPEVWKSIVEQSGSVQHLSFLIPEQKKVFLTAREINQFSVVRLAGQRQQFIDQAQSINLFFAANSDPKYISQVHVEAWKAGLKSLYYLRSEGVIRGDLASRSTEECIPCQG